MVKKLKKVLDFGGLRLKSPFISSSGCWGYGWEGEEYFPGLGWGAVVTKTVTVSPREGNPPPRIFEVQGGIINRVGLQNCGLNSFRVEHLPHIRKLPYPALISIFGNTPSEWKKLVKDLDASGVAGFELNLSCPNLKGEALVKNPSACATFMKETRKLTKLPVWAKINAVDTPVALSKVLTKAGADAIVCSNTLPAAVMHEGEMYQGGLSGPAIKPVVLKAVGMISDAVDADIAACGGIVSKEDVDDYRAAGAKAFVLGSVLLSYPDRIKKI